MKYYGYAIFLITFITVSFIIYYSYDKQKFASQLMIGESQKVAEETSFLVSNIERSIHDAFFLTQMDSVGGILSGEKENCKVLSSIYSSYMRSHYGIEQIRLLNVNGDEVLRINNTADGESIVPQSELQNKSKRYYFQKAIKMAPGGSYISNFDLNYEKGKVEIPYRPVFRIAMPIFDSDRAALGVFVLNYSASNLLSPLKAYGVYVLDGKNHMIAGPDKKDGGGFHDDDTSEEILMEKSWIIVSILHDYNLSVHLSELRLSLTILWFFLILLAVLFAEILAKNSFEKESEAPKPLSKATLEMIEQLKALEKSVLGCKTYIQKA